MTVASGVQQLLDEIVSALTPVADAPGRSIDWISVNGRRVDVGVVAPPDREWRVACSIDTSGVHSAIVLERPRG